MRAGALVIEIDRWGRFLLQLRDATQPAARYPDAWGIPGGALREGESPDAAALREFEEETGHRLETIKLFRVFRRDPDIPTSLVDVQHVYYIDADLDEDLLEVKEGRAFRYYRPDELAALEMPPDHRVILEQFATSPAYKGMFH